MQTEKQLLDIAIEFGVTTYETSLQLSELINKPSNWYWCENKHGKTIKSLSEAILLNDKHGNGYLSILCEAYSMHEIAKLIPNGLLTKEYGYKELNIFTFSNRNIRVGYPLVAYSETQNDHYAEAFGKLYLTLKNNNLL